MQRTNPITLVGPVDPYSGGIAQYTTQMHYALGKQCDLQTISFKRLYPKFLYPGKGNTKLEGSDLRLQKVIYSIDAYSPLSWRRTADIIIDSGSRVVILSWWTLFWQPGMAYIARRLRKHGIKSIYLCHNLFDHEAKGFKKALGERLLKNADGYIVHASDQAALLKRLNPEAAILQRMHPIYTHFPKPKNPKKKRGRLELLFFGFIRPYKGLDILLEALTQLNDTDVYLRVVGEHWGEARELRAKINQSLADNIELHLEYVDDQAAADYFAGSDIVVLPYLSATGSGVATLAYNYGKPVIATDVGGLRDAVIDGKTGWVVPSNSPKELANLIANIKRSELPQMTPHVRKLCKENDWESMAKTVASFCSSLIL